MGVGLQEGRFVARWIEEQAAFNRIKKIPNLIIHSSNTVAEQDMKAAFKNANKFWDEKNNEDMKKFEIEFYFNHITPLPESKVELVKNLFSDCIETKGNLFCHIDISTSKKCGYITFHFSKTAIFNIEKFVEELSKTFPILEIGKFYDSKTSFSCIYDLKQLENKELVRLFRDTYVPDAAIKTIPSEEADNENFFEGWNEYYDFDIPTSNIQIRTTKNFMASEN